MKHYLLLPLLFAFSIAHAQHGWYAVPGAPVTSNRFEDVTFVGQKGWVAENEDSIIIHHTNDGGDTWTAIGVIPDGTMARSLEFINDTVGIVGMLTSAGNISHTLYRTADGGYTFQPVISSAIPQNLGYSACGLAHYGNTIIGVGLYSGGRYFFKSTDTGLTWTTQILDTFLVSGLIDCHMFNDSVYIACGQFNNGTVQKAVILKTYDGGATWTNVASSSENNTWAWKIHFRENGAGTCSIETSTKLWATADSGSTWTELNVGSCIPPFPAEYGGAGFLNDTLGWTAEQWPTCWAETRDGGTTWNHFNFGERIDRMVTTDSVTMLAVGLTIYKFSFDSMNVTSIYEAVPSPSLAELKVHPNPADKKLVVETIINKNMSTQLRLLDSNLRIVKNFPVDYLIIGNYIQVFDTSELPSGNYIVELITDIPRIVEKVQIIH